MSDGGSRIYGYRNGRWERAPILTNRDRIHPETRIGHVHLKVADIERASGFYRDLLGFEVTQWYGDEAVFLSAGS